MGCKYTKMDTLEESCDQIVELLQNIGINFFAVDFDVSYEI